MDKHLHRRDMLAGAAAVVALGIFPGATAAAQSRRGPLGLPLPPEITSLLPREATQIASVVETLLGLEREADSLRLPRSLLELGTLAPMLGLAPDGLYSAALPRLVALIDRSGVARGSNVGNRAAELLSRLHADEWRMPEALVPLPDTETNAPFSFQDAAPGAPPWTQTPEPAPPLPPFNAQPVVQPLPGVPPADRPPEDPPSEPAAETEPQEESGQNRPISRSTSYGQLAQEYERLFATASLRAERRQTAEWHTTMLRQSRSRYERVAARTGVPWYFIGATHGLEASFNFRAHLHNGDYPLTTRTRQVPAGRPSQWLPPSDWESSAIDALRHMGFAGQSDWSLPRTLYRLEAYNGFGYRRRATPSPYLWSFSQHYERGKFIADGRWSATARSQQCGAAVMMKLLAESGDIRFD